jgi:sugar/nucleoside kinase (ribokinase family)
MKLLIIGPSVVDKIKIACRTGRYKNNVTVKPGGIFYTVISLISFLRDKDELFLCTAIDKESKKLFSPVYDKISKDYIYESELIPRVHLTISDSEEREEKYENITENLFVDLSSLNKFDGILINMITGFDLTLEQVQMIRKNFKGKIYFDVHTFSRGLDENFKRSFRKIKDFQKWAECVDFIQANEMELKTLSEQADESEIINELFSFGIEQLIITKAEKGAVIFYKEENKINSVYINAIQVETINKVGCGDVFGAVYFYNYIRNKNIVSALELANTAAGITLEYSELHDYLNLNKDVQKRLTEA